MGIRSRGPSTGTWPLLLSTAYWHVSQPHGQPSPRSHFTSSRLPLPVALIITSSFIVKPPSPAFPPAAFPTAAAPG